MKHWDHLSKHVPDLVHKKILDLGSGRGAFLIEAAQHGAQVVGLELSEDYIKKAYASAEQAGVIITVKQGRAEQLPFSDGSFDFINICEVIEHVDDPGQMLREVRRVLTTGGYAYMSVPNRYSIKDPHFHLYFVNWLPRIFADPFISLFGEHKNYSSTGIGIQRLADMHYYTYGSIRSFVRSTGLEPVDIRIRRIHEAKGFKRILLASIYPLARALYFDSFHLLLQKN